MRKLFMKAAKPAWALWIGLVAAIEEAIASFWPSADHFRFPSNTGDILLHPTFQPPVSDAVKPRFRLAIIVPATFAGLIVVADGAGCCAMPGVPRRYRCARHAIHRNL
jgi:hypothetical protein